jgi:hypothetical protein
MGLKTQDIIWHDLHHYKRKRNLKFYECEIWSLALREGAQLAQSV